ncbi:hypothetical protein YC2023_083513 [Brassica napus]
MRKDVSESIVRVCRFSTDGHALSIKLRNWKIPLLSKLSNPLSSTTLGEVQRVYQLPKTLKETNPKEINEEATFKEYHHRTTEASDKERSEQDHIGKRFKRYEDMMRSTKGKLTRIYTETQHLRSKSIGEDGVGERINGRNHEAFTQTVLDGEKIANVAGMKRQTSFLSCSVLGEKFRRNLSVILNSSEFRRNVSRISIKEASILSKKTDENIVRRNVRQNVVCFLVVRGSPPRRTQTLYNIKAKVHSNKAHDDRSLMNRCVLVRVDTCRLDSIRIDDVDVDVDPLGENQSRSYCEEASMSIRRSRRYRSEILNSIEAELSMINEILNSIEAELSMIKRKLRSNVEDGNLWRRKSGFKQKFSTHETWMLLRETGSHCGWARGVWFSQATPKFAFLTWLAMLDNGHSI